MEGDIRVEGNIPYQMNFELDKVRLLELLVGHTIYNDPTVAIRELLQNSIDAVRYQYYLMRKKTTLPNDPQPKMGRVLVKWDADKRELIIEDNGTGMDLDVIKFHLMRVGSSFYNTSKFQTENSDYTPISRFGIGILTCFMISDDIEIVTCKKECGYRIRMSSVKGSYLLKKLELGDEILEGLEPHGTRVKLQVRQSIETTERSILDIIRYWIILPDCKVIYAEKGKEDEIIGFENPSKALEHYIQSDKKSNVEIVNTHLEKNGSNYELTFAVRSNAFTPEKNFAFYEIEEKFVPPAVCVEGIRVDEKISGFSKGENLAAIYSIKGNKTIRTTVSRTNIEKDKDYTKIGMICAELFSNYIKDEVAKISNLKGEPLSQASTASMRLHRTLVRQIDSDEILEYFGKLYANIPTIVIENTKHEDTIVTSRSLISEEELKKLDIFWAIESRLIDSLGIISRDLGRELSLNDFLGKLAPELLDERISPILPDAHLFTDAILLSHQLYQVEFSNKNHQTLMKWGLKEEVSYDKCFFIKFFDKTGISYLRKFARTHDRYDRYVYTSSDIFKKLSKPLLFVPIKGDINKVRGIKTRLVTIVNPESRIVNVFRVLEKATKKITIYDSVDTETLIEFLDLMIDVAGIQYLKKFDMARNCDIYAPFRIRSDSDCMSEKSWREKITEINGLLNHIGINEKIDFSIDQLLKEGEIFDASNYWLDWNDL